MWFRYQVYKTGKNRRETDNKIKVLACDCTNSLKVHHAFIIECLVHEHLKNNSTHAESPNNDKQQSF